MADQPLNILCIACYYKGDAFIRACKELGANVYLITAQHLADEPWPRECLDDIFFVPDTEEEWRREDLIKGVSHLAKTIHIDRIVPLDDFDLEKAAYLREHLRVAGMGDTRTRFFRDKLAMRTKAQGAGIPVPGFVHLLNEVRVRQFTETVQNPWVLKPRSQASATGIQKIHSYEQLLEVQHELGDEQSFYLLEQFIPGAIYHVDSIVFEGRVVFARTHRYATPPMEVAHEGRVFSTHTVAYGSEDDRSMRALNAAVIEAMGLRAGVSHTEFIKAEDGTIYFLETSARVGGAHIAEMLEASSGINQWTEWARIECLRTDEQYVLPEAEWDHAGLLISLARQENPDTSIYNDPEVSWRLNRHHHAGLIVKSKSLDRVKTLLADYTTRFYDDFFASQPLPDKPTS